MNRDQLQINIDMVQLPSGIWMQRYPVTQSLYRDVMGINPSHFSGDNNPVECVSWYDAVEFCKEVTEQTGDGLYRLPTEAEWEYAYRADTTTRWYNGDDESKVGEIAWFSGNSDKMTHPVGFKQPNAWGLHDMAGNVWEWTNTAINSLRVIRGGSWNYDALSAWAVDGIKNAPSRRNYDVGFRVVKEQK